MCFRAVARLSEQMRQVSRAPKTRASTEGLGACSPAGNLLNLLPLKCYFQHFFFQHHEVFLQNSISCRPKTADKMKLEFERLCLWYMPPFDCSILCRVSLHLVCAKFFQGSPPIAKFPQANFRPRDLPSMISFYLAKYCQYLSKISFQTAKYLGISPKYRFQAM